MALAFDATFYLSQNPDVAAAISRGTIASAQDHYNNFGRFEGRNPSAYFDTAFYLAQNPDVAAARVNPFQHFLQFGAAEGRFANNTADSALDVNNNNIVDANEFNSAAYLAANADVAANVGEGKAFASAYQHFILFGQFESRPGVTVGPFTNTGVAPNTGNTLTFTTNLDVLNGTSGNDTFVGDDATVSTADRVNGGAGIDTLSLVDTSKIATLSSIERIEFTNNTAARTVDLSGVTGLTEVVLKSGITAGTLTTAAGVVTTYDATTAAATTATTAATATSQTVQLTNGSNLTTLTANGAAVANLTIQSNGSAANTIGTLAGSAGATTLANSTLTVTGSQKLTVTNALDVDFTKVDASGSTGGVDLTFGANTVTATGGSGNDRFAFSGNLGAGDTLVGGAGTDTVAISGQVLTAGATLTALNTKVAGFEVLEFTGAAATTITGGTGANSFTNSEITKILFNTTDAANLDTVENAGSSRTYAFGALNDGAATLNTSAGVTGVNVALEGITGNGGNVGALTVNFTNSPASQVGTGTINLSSIGTNDAANVNSTGLITGQSNGAALTSTNVVVTGNHDLSITGLGTAGTVNASAFTGKLTVTGSTAQDVIVGGTGADTINASAGGDTYTGGAGADKFVFTAVDQGSRAALTTITDFAAGTDKLDLTTLATATTFTATAVNVSAAPDFQGALNAAAAGTAAGGAITYFQLGGDTYVVVDNSTDATFNTTTDAVIKLTGLVSLTATDIVA